MRAVDGAVVVVCAVEGIMPQTETVLRQALKENVKPVLFINKVDRLINELKLEPEELQKRFINIYMEANKLIKPDIQVFASQVKNQFPSISKPIFTISIAIGVGLFITIGLLTFQ